MREIIFRGIISEETIFEDLTKGNFVYGLVYGSSRDCMINEDGLIFPVIPETIGQFCGLLDKNGVKIFKYDIVKMYSEIMPEWAVTIKKVEWYKEEGRWNLGQRDARMIWEVIGNVHDNKNLLEN